VWSFLQYFLQAASVAGNLATRLGEGRAQRVLEAGGGGQEAEGQDHNQERVLGDFGALFLDEELLEQLHLFVTFDVLLFCLTFVGPSRLTRAKTHPFHKR
jgi:hypothetical protein